MSGRKSKILIDSIDLEILSALTKEREGSLGVLELTKKIGLTHQNLKAHLEKLIRAELVIPLKSFDEKGNNKINLTTIGNNFYKDNLDDFFDTELEKKEFQKDVSKFNDFLFKLRKIDSIDFEKDTLRNIILELKKHKKA